MSALMLIWLGWAAFTAPPAEPAAYEAIVSAYSCDNYAANGMYPCGPFRDGTRPHSGLHGVVAAGPVEWLGRTVHIEGYGAVRLVDTPRTAWYGEKVHIDVFLAFPDAVRWGIQERSVLVE